MSDSVPESVSDAERLDALLEAMHAAADAAGEITRVRFRRPLEVENKTGDGAFDPVTSADRDAEKAIRARLARAFPEIAFHGEESAATPGDGVVPAATDPGGSARAAARWVVDPIDGTRSFVSGIPLWGTLIALEDGRDVPLGLLDQPVLGERYVGRPGGAFLHARGSVRRLRARSGRRLEEAVLCCTSPEMFDRASGELAAFERVAARARLVRFGTDCYAYAQLAAGHVDAVVESDMKPWDILALVPLVRGAGGRVSDWRGGPPASDGRVVAAGSAALHEALLERLSEVPPATGGTEGATRS